MDGAAARVRSRATLGPGKGPYPGAGARHVRFAPCESDRAARGPRTPGVSLRETAARDPTTRGRPASGHAASPAPATAAFANGRPRLSRGAGPRPRGPVIAGAGDICPALTRGPRPANNRADIYPPGVYNPG